MAPGESPADTIRRAVETLRELTAQVRADLATNPYWPTLEPDAPEWKRYSLGAENALGGAAGEFAAPFSPGFADAVAAWLEAELECHQKTAEIWAAQPAPDGYQWTVGFSTLGLAIAVARAYLGEEATDGR